MSAATVASAGLAAAVIELTGIAGTIIMLLPVIVLLVVVARALRQARPQTPPISESKLPRQSEMMSAIHSDGLPVSPQTSEPISDTPPSDRVSAPAASVGANLKVWPARIEAAEAANDLASVASHYLAYAREEIAGGQVEQAADHLRSSVRASARGKYASIQAEARLELAELARKAGDLTTACEHWQIARGLFHGLKRSAELGETEKLMQKHGCPTDWVLNDF